MKRNLFLIAIFTIGFAGISAQAQSFSVENVRFSITFYWDYSDVEKFITSDLSRLYPNGHIEFRPENSLEIFENVLLKISTVTYYNYSGDRWHLFSGNVDYVDNHNYRFFAIYDGLLQKWDDIWVRRR